MFLSISFCICHISPNGQMSFRLSEREINSIRKDFEHHLHALGSQLLPMWGMGQREWEVFDAKAEKVVCLSPPSQGT